MNCNAADSKGKSSFRASRMSRNSRLSSFSRLSSWKL